MVKYTQKPEEIFSALGQPIRVQMVERLAQNGRMSVSTLAEPFSISLPGVLKNVKVLQSSGVISCEKEGRVQYCRINPDVFDDIHEWMAKQEHFWNESLARLEKHIADTKSSKN